MSTIAAAPKTPVTRVVHIAAGDRGKLEETCQRALADTRDLMHQAEYDSDDRRIRQLDQPFS